MSDEAEPRVVRLANQYMAWCRSREQQLGRWPGMWGQIERAAASIVANAGEAFDSETAPLMRQYFGYARASAGESARLVMGATRAGMIAADAAKEGVRLLKNIRWDLHRLIEWTQR